MKRRPGRRASLRNQCATQAQSRRNQERFDREVSRRRLWPPLFSAVDALREQVAQDPLPPPSERKRLREAAGFSQEQVAKALKSRRESIGNWESGRSEPRPPKRAAYVRLLQGLAARFPTSVSKTTADQVPDQSTDEEI
ncbi:helix-turn-helix domain-containing protein [Streptomyces sp. NPDC093228]|uniref:helix-turn-helix transcriptional regulator n=1 Tax=Streptomyces sp. NPDC093228 TaxID=3155070 RepID=UPI0034258D82